MFTYQHLFAEDLQSALHRTPHTPYYDLSKSDPNGHQHCQLKPA